MPDSASNSERNIGIQLIQQGKMAEAIPHLEQAILENNRDPVVYSLLGIAYSAQGKQNEALIAFERAVQLDQNNVKNRFNYAVQLQQMGDLNKAKYEAGFALKIDPNHAGAKNLIETIDKQIQTPLKPQTAPPASAPPPPKPVKPPVPAVQPKQPKKPADTGPVCPDCGAPLTDMDENCWQCGKRLFEPVNLIPGTQDDYGFGQPIPPQNPQYPGSPPPYFSQQPGGGYGMQAPQYPTLQQPQYPGGVNPQIPPGSPYTGPTGGGGLYGSPLPNQPGPFGSSSGVDYSSVPPGMDPDTYLRMVAEEAEKALGRKNNNFALIATFLSFLCCPVIANLAAILFAIKGILRKDVIYGAVLVIFNVIILLIILGVSASLYNQLKNFDYKNLQPKQGLPLNNYPNNYIETQKIQPFVLPLGK